MVFSPSSHLVVEALGRTAISFFKINYQLCWHTKKYMIVPVECYKTVCFSSSTHSTVTDRIPRGMNEEEPGSWEVITAGLFFWLNFEGVEDDHF